MRSRPDPPIRAGDRVDSVDASTALRAASSRRSDGTPEFDLVAAESSSERWLKVPIAITIARLVDRVENKLRENSSFGRRIDSRMTISISREGSRNSRFLSTVLERMKVLLAQARENVLSRVDTFILAGVGGPSRAADSLSRVGGADALLAREGA
jgi:hypothetical protein